MDISQFVSAGVSAWDIVFALVSVAVAWIAAHFTRKGVIALILRVPNVPPAIAPIAGRTAYYLVLLLGIGIGLAFLGANVQPLLGVLLIAVVVAVLVLRGVADNFASGLLIQTRQTVKLGDEIQIDGPDGALTGVVTELNSRALLLRTVDGRTVHVPNAKALADALVNHSTHGLRRTEVQIRVERSGATVVELASLVTAAAATASGVLAAPVPRALATTVSPERVTLRLQYWHPPLDAIPVTSAVVEHVAAAIEADGRRGTVTSAPGVPPLVPPDAV